MARKQKTKRTKSRKKQAERNIVTDSKIREEIVLIITCLFSFLLFFSNLGFCGFLGEILVKIQFFFFGTFAFLFPFLLLFLLLFFMAQRENPTVYRRIFSIIIFYLFLESFIGTIFLGKEIPFDFNSLLDGGGVLGNGILFLLSRILGKLGALFVLFFLLLLSLVFITEKPIVSLFTAYSVRTAEKAGRKAKEDIRRISENAKEALREHREKREQREARGVDFSATDFHLEDFAEESKDNAGIPFKEMREEGGFSFEELDLTRGLGESSDNRKDEEFSDREGSRPEENGIVENGSFILKEDILESPMTIEERGRSRKRKAEEDSDLKKRLLEQDSSTRVVETASGGRIASDMEKLQERIAEKKEEQEINPLQETPPYHFPPLSLLKCSKDKHAGEKNEIEKNARTLQETLKSFGISVSITNVSVGPSVTRYELQPEQGVKLAKIVSLSNDIKMRLAAADIRIEAPIPGKSAVGIEVPNKNSQVVYLGDILSSEEFQKNTMRLAFGVGKDIAGKVVVTDIAKMPHLLVAGATGAGKSVSINTLIMSILYKYSPEEVRMIMVDPKVVELQVYNGIPHLLIPVVTDPKKAAQALNWAVAEMTNRYKKFANFAVRDLAGYNEKIRKMSKEEREKEGVDVLPQIIIIIDELADLMMVSAQEVEDAIVRLTQLARACGMHLIIATQRPSVNVITGLIKANVPSRIAFSVSSGVDSRTIIDMNGAEKLLGKGDMLFFPQNLPKPIRVQGAFVSDEEVGKVTDFLKNQGTVEYNERIIDSIEQGESGNTAETSSSDRDELFIDAARTVIDTEKASIGFLQRRFRIGFNRAARIMDQLAEAHIVGEEEGTKARQILMSEEEFEANFVNKGE